MRSEQNATRTIPRHYVRAGRVQRSITRLITLDTESRQVQYARYTEHQMRCWVARLDQRDADHFPISSAQYAYGTDRDSVADQVEAWTRSRHTTWLYAHNLSFDASMTDLPQELVRRGWTMTASHIIESPVWFAFSKGRRRLVLADSHGVWPCALAALASDMGMAKEDLPDNDDDDMAGWWARCEVDVTILANALLRALNYWDENKLGRWSITGSGSGWSVYKTNFITDEILIDVDDAAMTFEQRASYGGRREAYRMGEWKSGQFVDLDFRAAYPSVVANHDIPVRRLRRFSHMDSADHMTRRRDRGVIAECHVITTVPCVPVRYGESIFYPVGRFRTVLASPEIDLIVRLGGHVTIGAGYEYRLGPAMRLWGEWIRALITDPDNGVDPIVRRMAKHWSRAVIGRWTMRLSTRVPLEGVPPHGQLVTRSEWLDYDPRDCFEQHGLPVRRSGAVPIRRIKGYQLLYGGQYYALKQDRWPENGFPAIWAWVESWCRVALADAMADRPHGDVWQCDTDGFLIGRPGRPRRSPPGLRPAATSGTGPARAQPRDVEPLRAYQGLELVEKGRYGSARILGPQHVVLGGQRRFPGVPRTAEEIGPDTFKAQTWPGFLDQVQHETPGTFRTGTRTLKIGAGLNPRWALANGRTLPVEMGLDQGGYNKICSAPEWSGGHRVTLADAQHSVLSRVRHS